MLPPTIVSLLLLNPIEEAFSAWKASVKNELATAEVTSRINNRTAAAAMGFNLLDYRRTDRQFGFVCR